MSRAGVQLWSGRCQARDSHVGQPAAVLEEIGKFLTVT